MNIMKNGYNEKDILFIDATIDKTNQEEYKKNIKQITKFISNIVDDSNYYNNLTLQDIMAHPFYVNQSNIFKH